MLIDFVHKSLLCTALFIPDMSQREVEPPDPGEETPTRDEPPRTPERPDEEGTAVRLDQESGPRGMDVTSNVSPIAATENPTGPSPKRSASSNPEPVKRFKSDPSELVIRSIPDHMPSEDIQLPQYTVESSYSPLRDYDRSRVPNKNTWLSLPDTP